MHIYQDVIVELSIVRKDIVDVVDVAPIRTSYVYFQVDHPNYCCKMRVPCSPESRTDTRIRLISLNHARSASFHFGYGTTSFLDSS